MLLYWSILIHLITDKNTTMITNINEMTSSFKAQLQFLLNHFQSMKGVSITVGVQNNYFDADSFHEFFGLDLEPMPIFLNGKLGTFPMPVEKKSYLIHQSGKEEESEYKTLGTIYVVHPEMFFELQLIQEFKNGGKTLFKDFALVTGKIKQQFQFTQISANLEDGAKNLGSSFKEALENIEAFIKHKCEKAQ